MGNRLCKNKRMDTGDGGGGFKTKNQSRFDRIFSRFHLKPTTWKSESHLTNQNKQAIARNDRKSLETTLQAQPLSKSTDWTDATLEVPDHKIHLKNPQLSLIFDNSEKSTPTPPPRKHHKKNFREKIESVARNGLQALKNKPEEEKAPMEVEEPMFVKKKINYKCPVCESDEINHNRDHHHHNTNRRNDKNVKKEANLEDITNLIIPNDDPRLQDPTTNKKQKKNDNKNGSVTSLPNYNDLKLSVAKTDSSEEKNSSKSGSRLSLQSNQSKKLNTARLDSYLGRVRSFGSLIPQKLNKVKPHQKPPKDNVKVDHTESDDSFGPLEDWDLGLIEHYNPKEASLPRPRKKPQKSSKEVLSGIEGLVVREEEDSTPQSLRNSAPIPKKEVAVYRNLPQLTRIQEKLNQNAQVPKAVPEDVCLTPPPSPKSEGQKTDGSKMEDIPLSASSQPGSPEIGHSNLLRIIKELSPQPSNDSGSNMSSLTPSLLEFEKTLNVMAVEDFINAEKVHTNKSIGHI